MSNARQVYQRYLDEARPALRYRLGADLLLHSCLEVQRTVKLTGVSKALLTPEGLKVQSPEGTFLYTSQALVSARHAAPPAWELVRLDVAEDLAGRLAERGVKVGHFSPQVIGVAQALMTLLHQASALTDDKDVLKDVLGDLLREECQRPYSQLQPAD